MKESPKPIRMVLDALVLGVLVLAANYLIDDGDAGWRWLNPTPYIAIPLLLGGRYGFSAGLAGGVLAGVLMLGAVLAFGDRDTAGFLHSHPFTFVALPVVGIAAGEIHRYLAQRGSDLREQNDALREESARLARQLEVARDTQHDLQGQLALHGAEYCSLDLELRRLFQPDAGPLLPNTLHLLAHFTGVTDAAVYAVVGSVLEREAHLGDVEAFPARLFPDDEPIARVALDSGKLASPRSLWESTPELGDRYLAALPLNGAVRRILLVHRMPFLSVNWHTFARIQMICEWVAMMEEAGGNEGGALEVTREQFGHAVDLALAAAAGHGLPSAVLVVCAAAAGTMMAAEIRELALPVLLGGELLHSGALPEPHLAILLPFAGKREAAALSDRIATAASARGAGLRFRHLPVAGEADRPNLAAL